MKIRVTGTKNELEALKQFLWSKFKPVILNLSNFYPNRGMSNEGRIYIETKEFIGYNENRFQFEFKHERSNKIETQDPFTLPGPEGR